MQNINSSSSNTEHKDRGVVLDFSLGDDVQRKTIQVDANVPHISLNFGVWFALQHGAEQEPPAA